MISRKVQCAPIVCTLCILEGQNHENTLVEILKYIHFKNGSVNEELYDVHPLMNKVHHIIIIIIIIIIKVIYFSWGEGSPQGCFLPSPRFTVQHYMSVTLDTL